MRSESETKVVRRSLDRQAADILREHILSGRFAPGDRLVETQLAEQVQVSRGTVRSALSELAHQGLVQQVAYTKWMVPELSAKDAWEIYTLRGVLEGFGARLAAESPNPDKSKILDKALRPLVASVKLGDRAKAAEADFKLHRSIIALADHSKLVGQYELIEQQVRRYMSLSNDVLTIPEDIISEHEALVSAILDGDAETAERLARSHNVEESDTLRRHLEGEERNGVT
jgi:DNA-binding GntR family transcriptional regulator